MNAILKNALALAIPLALVACGGGSGDNNAPADPPSNNDNNNMVTPPPPGASNKQPSGGNYGLTDEEIQGMQALSDSPITVEYGNFPGAVQLFKSSDVRNNISSPNSLKLVYGSTAYKHMIETESGLGTIFLPDEPDQASHVSGVDVYKDYRGYTSMRSFTDFSYFLHSDDSYGAIQFGIAKTKDADPSIVAFYRGTPTPEQLLPQSGTFTYRGDWIVFPDTMKAAATPVGTVAANISFDNKDAAMQFNGPHGYSAGIKAKVVGSMLSGREGGKFVEGIFAGLNGGEVVGKYVDADARLYGVYGIKRQ